MHYYGSGFTNWGSGIGFNFIDPLGGPSQPYNASMYQGIKFWAKIESGSSTAIRVVFPNSQTHPDGGLCGTACWDHFGLDFTLTTTWQQYTLPFSSLTQQWWVTQFPTFDVSTIYNMEFRHSQNVSYNVWIDNIEFYGAITPTQTITNTATRTNTATFTPTNTQTFTGTNTPSFTITSTSTETPTPTETVTGSQLPTWTNTNTMSSTPTDTITHTPTHTVTSTFTNSGTNTPSYTATNSQQPTMSFTATCPQATTSQTPTYTTTFSATPSATTTFSQVPINTATPTLTQGIVESEGIKAIIYPNLLIANNDLKIKFSTSKKIKNIEIRIYSISFRLIFDFMKVKDFNLNDEIIIDKKYIKNLAKGIY